MVAEFVCMLPTIFPGLESRAAQHDDGGATGSLKLLWAAVFVASMVSTIQNLIHVYSMLILYVDCETISITAY